MTYTIGLIILSSLVIYALDDSYMHPICPSCGDNLNSHRLKHLHEKALCTRHGEFDIQKKKI